MRESKKVLIISPAFPTAINGLGDYSAILGKELVKMENIQVSYGGLKQLELVSVAPYFEISSTNTIAKIAKQNQIKIIFLSYVNYGYQKKGIPFWLLNQLRDARKDQIKIITFFHEAYASGKPWQSVFWLKPFQKHIFHQIYQLSNRCFCNTEHLQEIIKNTNKDKGIKAKNIGIFSNIEEPYNLPAWDKRKNVAVVFGSVGKRKEVLNNKEYLQHLIKYFSIEKVIDIGDGDINLEYTPTFEIDRLGKLNSQEVSNILKYAKWGLINYHEGLLAKSGIFAAYASHALVIINLSQDSKVPKDGLVKNKHYIGLNGLHQINHMELSENAKFWYQTKDRKSHMQKIFEAFRK